ncbi:YsnF/AvaK domain-containing protein [Granulicella sp. L60]|uniref:YsnF/AvaK domain-containing protein n=1 Tax=Granulicella sp. L60 TaxID=1641866 RepID=UPI00131AD311|nr:YsnF/AvaK domain-containing protein [Granulicella sp. L60]
MNPSLNHSDAVDTAVTRVDRETVIPVFEEELSVTKRVVETARVRVSRVTHTHQQLVDELLQLEKVEVEHVPIDRQVEVMPSIRQEGDVTIIPVVEEVLKVERHLVLKEEVYIRRIKQTERYQESVTLRRQEAEITRLPIEQPAVPEAGAQSNATEPRKEYK